MVGGEGCEPMHRQVMGPDDKDGYVYGENPKHEDQH